MGSNPGTNSVSVEEAVATVNALSLTEMEQGEFFTYSAIASYSRYTKGGALEDVRDAVQLGRLALRRDRTEMAVSLNNLGVFLETLFERLGRLDDLEEAITVTRLAVEDTPEDSPDMASLLSNLGNKLGRRFERLGSLDNLEEAITVTRRAVEDTPEDSPDMPSRLSNLGNKLESRFERLGMLDNLEEAIAVTRRAVELTSGENPKMASRLSNLGSKLEKLFKRLGRLDNLEEAITVMRRAVEIIPEDDTDIASLLNNIGNKLESRFERLGTIDDLEEAITVTRRAVEITPEDSPAIASRLNNLGNVLERRFERLGRLDNLEEAIAVTRRALEITPEDSPDLASWLSNLGNKLGLLFERLGSLDNLEEAITVMRQAVEITPEDSPNMASWLSNLGTKLEKQFKRLGRLDNLEEAITVMRRAVELTPEDSPGMAVQLNNLGTKLEQRFERLGRLDDLEEAIAVTRRAAEITPKDSPDMASWLSNLGNKLETRFERLGSLDNLEEAITVTRRAVEDTPEDSPNMASWLSNLGNKLEKRFERLGSLDNLEEAITVTRRAVEDTPRDSPGLTSLLNNLGRKLSHRFERLGRLGDLKEAIAKYDTGWQCSNGVPLHRIRCAKQCVGLLKQEEMFDRATGIAKEALRLLPAISTRALSRQDQQTVLESFSGLAADACALRLQCGRGEERDAEEALLLVEAGRAAIIGIAFDDRADLVQLEELHPLHASRLKSIKASLNLPLADRSDEESRHRSPFQLLEVFDACVEEIRSLDGFRTFMRAPGIEEAKIAAADGPILVVNVSDLRSDAIVVESNRIRSIHLPHLEYPSIRKWVTEQSARSESFANLETAGRMNASCRVFLKWLWKNCVRPIANELGFQPKDAELLPRVWWIGTGIASSIPFHAAGMHGSGLIATTLGRMVSSYTPSIQALMHARRTESSRSLSTKGNALLMVTMETTPDESPLPGVREEARVVQETLGQHISITYRPQPTALAMIDLMQGNEMFHFAGHGSSHNVDPAKSCLIVEQFDNDRQQMVKDCLHVEQLFSMDLERGVLAYLSACSTAENLHEDLADESMHLASAFLVAGYRHVIASLWPSNDDVCVDVAKEYYRELRPDGGKVLGNGDFARALHIALIRLYADRQEQPLLWAQYIHVGA